VAITASLPVPPEGVVSGRMAFLWRPRARPSDERAD